MNNENLRKGGGRPKGVPNKATREIKETARRLVEDPVYVAALAARLIRGKAPRMEVLLHYYAYGKPTETVDVKGLTDIAAALAKKVIHESHPGPTKAH